MIELEDIDVELMRSAWKKEFIRLGILATTVKAGDELVFYSKTGIDSHEEERLTLMLGVRVRVREICGDETEQFERAFQYATCTPKASVGACPACGSVQSIPIWYGLIDREEFDGLQEENFVQGGCLLEEDSPTHQCTGCGCRYILEQVEMPIRHEEN
ncbi:hypothetical protein [Geobacter sp. DSM 9736]|uniref:hypothetical protein n=1 Tax=Geobacter sp. DSM 9736 TaxID=1277350 RepID=UPI000B505183|nr:hypothetical protein [Geobacter sp. DSM 9736]SNB44912.1 hypothetical protein SAMN06269301_0302 [Geobacter sp. DSM 9736]